MPMTTIAFGISLIVQGLVGFLGSGKASKTALIPSFLGGAMALLGALAHRAGSRRLAMHAALGVAGLGVAGALMGGRRSAAPNPRAKAARATMAATCCTYVALSARSYLTGRCAEARAGEPAPVS